MKPLYEHVCVDCVFLGTVDFKGGDPIGLPRKYDAYRCHGVPSSPTDGSYIMRFGDEPHEYWSCPGDVAKDQLKDHSFVVAIDKMLEAR